MMNMQCGSLKAACRTFCVVVLFSVAFGYIESAVVVYLRQIFYPEGFTFPLNSFGLGDPIFRPLLLTEVGREAATILLILTGAWLAGRNTQQRVAYFMTIFAVWDIFYYVWLYVLIRWPTSIMDWDILFLIPGVWASPVLYPLIISITMLVFAVVMLCRDSLGNPIKALASDWIIFCGGGAIVLWSLCTAGPYITMSDYASHFHWPLFAAGQALIIARFLRCLTRPRQGGAKIANSLT